MSMKKRMKQGMGITMGMTGIGLGLGAGGVVTDKLSHMSGINVSGGITGFSGMMPVVGTIGGAGMAIGMLGEMIPREKKRRR
jgi:hypothetical protein